MQTLRITKISLSPIPSGIVMCTVKYKRATDLVYITVSSAVQVHPNGFLVFAVDIPNLLDETEYDILAQSNDGCNAHAERIRTPAAGTPTTTTTTLPAPGEVICFCNNTSPTDTAVITFTYDAHDQDGPETIEMYFDSDTECGGRYNETLIINFLSGFVPGKYKLVYRNYFHTILQQIVLDTIPFIAIADSETWFDTGTNDGDYVCIELNEDYAPTTDEIPPLHEGQVCAYFPWGGGGHVVIESILNPGVTYTIDAKDSSHCQYIPYGTYKIIEVVGGCPPPLVGMPVPPVGTNFELTSTNPLFEITISCV